MPTARAKASLPVDAPTRDAAGPPRSAATPTAPATPAERAMVRLGLLRDIDFALHLPLRYEDETSVTTVSAAREGELAQIDVTVDTSRVELRPRRQLVAHAHDDEGQPLTLRLLNFYPSQQKQLAAGARVRVRGEMRGGFFGREMVHPVLRSASAQLPTSLTPVYPTAAALPQAALRRAVAEALRRAPLHELMGADVLPEGLPTLRAALQHLHHPPPGVSLDALQAHAHPAWSRLKFDELLAQQLSQLLARQRRAHHRAPSLPATPTGLHARLVASLPFQLTAAQHRVVHEIDDDLARTAPMNRLLQGDVGSGKTVVAALAATRAIDAGWQCALMAPTEILAGQHFGRLVEWLQPLGVTIAWLSGSRKGRERTRMQALVASGEAPLIVGTHAVIQEHVTFARLGLAIVDEQHRFGVAQRLALRAPRHDTTVMPHLLMMSATPIPRTLAMTYFADLDVSTIDELPPGRTPIVTKLFADTRRDDVIARIRDDVAQGRQVYWVCPLIEESQEVDLRNATEAHATLGAALDGHEVGLLHGRMPAADKAAAMARFTGGQTAVLVATTVIEVGVDVPNASLMVVEHAERFGLSQLHQLRGRVGRGAVASVCVLLYTGPLSQTGRERLRAMIETNDGFEIARRDLEIRGPGEFMGARQSGDALLRFADLQADSVWLQQARAIAPRWLASHPEAAAAHVDRWLGGRAEFLKA